MREYRELRNKSKDDRAAPYIGVARTFLGKLKNQMVLGKLRQGIDRLELPDGAIIVVTSHRHPYHPKMDRDSIDITPPPLKADDYFIYEFILVTDIFTSVTFLATTHTITPKTITSSGTVSGFQVIDNDVGPYSSLPLFSQHQNIWYDSNYDIVASGTSIVRYAVKGNRSGTPVLLNNTMRYITIDETVESPAGSEVVAAVKQGDYLVGVTTFGVVVAWKIGDPTYETAAAVLPAWVDNTLAAFWSFNEDGTKVISTQYAAVDGGWRESGYVEMEITVAESGLIAVRAGRSKQASDDDRPIIAADYDHIGGGDAIIYATLTKEYDAGNPTSVFSKYIEIYSAEALIKSFLIESQNPDLYSSGDGVGWFGNVTAMDLRYRSYTWGYSQEHYKAGPDTTVAATSKASIRDGATDYSDTDVFVEADVDVLDPIEIRGGDPSTLQELEGFVTSRVAMTSPFSIALHPRGAWSFYTDFSSSFSSEEVKSSLDMVFIPVKNGADIATTHRALYDSARITTPALPEITTDWGTVAMGAASVWIQLRSRP